MLRSVKNLHGNKLGASDGDIGQVKDFYFDDQVWVVRYVIADTGNWLSGRQVLISPQAISSIDPGKKTMLANLTRKQISESPAIDTHKPVSRQYEEQYHRYYGWPGYWEGGGSSDGGRGFPILEQPVALAPLTLPAVGGPKSEPVDVHLRSTAAVTGYHLQTSDGFIVGHVCDFLMDDKAWAINQMVVKIGHRFTGKEVQITASQVERISYKESTVFVKLTRDAVEKSPEYRLVPNGAVIPIQPALAL